jgi:uncharacterized metal-binding protein YceD (DUF177 family)
MKLGDECTHGALRRQCARCDDELEITRLRAALTEIRNRIKTHPAYAELTEAEEERIGGDTAEFSYLARVADEALGQLFPEG